MVEAAEKESQERFKRPGPYNVSPERDEIVSNFVQAVKMGERADSLRKALAWLTPSAPPMVPEVGKANEIYGIVEDCLKSCAATNIDFGKIQYALEVLPSLKPFAAPPVQQERQPPMSKREQGALTEAAVRKREMGTTTIATEDYNLLVGALNSIRLGRFHQAEEAVKTGNGHEYAAKLQQIAHDVLLHRGLPDGSARQPVQQEHGRVKE